MLVHSRYRNAMLNLARNKVIVTLWDDQYRSRMMTKLHNYGVLDILFQAAFLGSHQFGLVGQERLREKERLRF